MNEIVIFADAYPRITNTLFLAAKYYRERPVTVLVNSPDLLKFLQEVNDKHFEGKLKLEFVELFRSDPKRVTARGLTRLLYIVPDILRERRFLKSIYKKHLRRIENCDVYVFSRGYMDFFVAKSLRKRNRVFYMSSYPIKVTPVQYRPRNIMDAAQWLIGFMVFGRGMALGQLPHLSGFRYMSDRFVEKKLAGLISDTERDEMLKDFSLSRFPVVDPGRFKVMYFDDGFYASGFMKDKDTFKRELSAVFEAVNEYFPEDEIAIKYHPGYHAENKFISGGTVLPDYIPGEFLFSDSIRIYVGMFSGALANVERGLAVSLADMLSFKSDEVRQQFKGMLLEMQHSDILFPRSLEEFREIVGRAHAGISG